MVPTDYNGSLIIYRRIIRPKFIKYQPSVDSLLYDTGKIGKLLYCNVVDF
jgi:hypothetical protein